MKITTKFYSDELKPEVVKGKVAVVIDLFRATSVITTALAHGVKEVLVAGSKEEAFDMAKNFSREECVLGGEEKMLKIPGFDYGNSPQDYTTDAIVGKTLIMSTTNGTKAIKFCYQAVEVCICSMLNCEAVAKKIATENREVVIVCAGVRGEFALEDSFCAGMLIDHLVAFTDCEIDDFSLLLKNSYKMLSNPKQYLANCRAYKNLLQKGFEKDIEFCLRKNIYSKIPCCLYNRDYSAISLINNFHNK